jgi:CRP-like cAMP-binding protein
MALDDDIRVLSGVRLFQSFTREQMRLLAFGAENMRLGSGRELYRENSQADCAYVVVSGRISLYRDHEGKRTRVGAAAPGAMLGEIALIAPTKRLTSAAAEEDTELIRLNRSLFRRILEEYPEVAHTLHRQIAAELHEMTDKISQLAPRFS